MSKTRPGGKESGIREGQVDISAHFGWEGSRGTVF